MGHMVQYSAAPRHCKMPGPVRGRPGADKRDGRVDMAGAVGLIHHGGGIVSVTDDALSLVVQSQFLAAQDVFSCALPFGLEVTGRADKCPLHITAQAQFIERLALCLCQRLEHIGEVRAVHHLGRVFPVHIQASGAAHHQQTGIGTAEDVAQVLKRGAVLGKGVLRPGAERINDHIKALEICGSQIEEVFLDDLLCLRPVLPTDHGRYIQPPAQGLLHNQFAGFPVGTYHCEFHCFITSIQFYLVLFVLFSFDDCILAGVFRFEKYAQFRGIVTFQ